MHATGKAAHQVDANPVDFRLLERLCHRLGRELGRIEFPAGIFNAGDQRFSIALQLDRYLRAVLFPNRDLILFLTFSVILVTLVGQGLMLLWVIRTLGLAHAGRRERHADKDEEHKARRQAIEAAIERLDQLATERHLSENVVRPLRTHQRDRLKHIEHRNDGDDYHRQLSELHDEIELQLIAAEQQQINDLFRSGKLKDEARRGIERELDLREAHLINQQAEE